MTTQEAIPRMRSIPAAATETGLSKDFLRKLCRQGRIIHIRVGTKIFINMDRLIDYLNGGDKG